MMKTIGRTLLAFVLGVGAGVIGTGWFFYSGAGDFVLKPSPVVRDLERRLDEVEAQRDQLSRSLEDVIRRFEASEARFRQLDERLQGMIAAAEAERGRAAPPPSAARGLEPDGE